MTGRPTVPIRPSVSWPRLVQFNEDYLMTVDLEAGESGADWLYDGEEYAVGVVVDGRPWSEVEPLDDGLVVLHRFGGSYGPARFAVRVGWKEPTVLRLTLFTAGGVPFSSSDLPVGRDELGAYPRLRRTAPAIEPLPPSAFEATPTLVADKVAAVKMSMLSLSPSSPPKIIYKERRPIDIED
jgi:hypothetical protein